MNWPTRPLEAPDGLTAWTWAGDVLDAVDALAEAQQAAQSELRAVRGLDPKLDEVLAAAAQVARMAR